MQLGAPSETKALRRVTMWDTKPQMFNDTFVGGGADERWTMFRVERRRHTILKMGLEKVLFGESFPKIYMLEYNKQS